MKFNLVYKTEDFSSSSPLLFSCRPLVCPTDTHTGTDTAIILLQYVHGRYWYWYQVMVHVTKRKKFLVSTCTGGCGNLQNLV